MSREIERRFNRRTFFGWAGASLALIWNRRAWALEPEVPIRLQVDLLGRVIAYDRGFAQRVRGELVVTVVAAADDSDSARVAAQVFSELQGRTQLGVYRQRTSHTTFVGVDALVDECRRRKTGILYFGPGLGVPIRELADALAGLGILTVATLPDQVRQGLVLGFAARSGKPRLLVNLSQARRQRVDFRADFLRMAEVVG